MPSPSRRRAAAALATLAIFAVAPLASGQVYKCTDASGNTTYSGAPCDAAAKPFKLPEDPKANPTNPHMCAQMLDETRRLDAEADRDAKRGRAESADHAAQRKKMKKRYSERCMGVTRSGANARPQGGV